MDVIDRYYAAAYASLIDRGLLLQQVEPDVPVEPVFTYTVGLSLLGAPELVVFGMRGDGGSLLTRFADRVRETGWRPRPGMVLDGFLDGGYRIRLDRVRPEWARAYCKGISTFLGRDDIPVLQLVLPDHDHRWPDEPSPDRHFLACQPVLRRRYPWLVPVTRGPDVDLFAGSHGGNTSVLVPVIAGADEWEGQYEAVAATRLADGSCVLRQPACLADWVAPGARVTTKARPRGVSAPRGSRVLRQVLDPGTNQNLHFSGCLGCLTHPDVVARALRRLAADPPSEFLAVSTTTSSVHIATDDPDAVRIRLRPLQRDGLLTEGPLRSAVGLDFEPCANPDCATSHPVE